MPRDVSNKDLFLYGGLNRHVPEGPAQLFTQHIYHLIYYFGEAARQQFIESDPTIKVPSKGKLKFLVVAGFLPIWHRAGASCFAKSNDTRFNTNHHFLFENDMRVVAKAKPDARFPASTVPLRAMNELSDWSGCDDEELLAILTLFFSKTDSSDKGRNSSNQKSPVGDVYSKDDVFLVWFLYVTTRGHRTHRDADVSVRLVVCAYPDILGRALHSCVHSPMCRSLFCAFARSTAVAKLPKEYLLLYAESVQSVAANVRSRQNRGLTIALGNTVAKLLIAHVSLGTTLELFGRMMFNPLYSASYDATYQKFAATPDPSSISEVAYHNLYVQCPAPEAAVETKSNPRIRTSSSCAAADPNRPATPGTDHKAKRKEAKTKRIASGDTMLTSELVAPVPEPVAPITPAAMDSSPVTPAVPTGPPVRSYKKLQPYLQQFVKALQEAPIPIPFKSIVQAENLNRAIVESKHDNKFYTFANQSFLSTSRARECFLGTSNDFEVQFSMSTTTGEPRLTFIPLQRKSLGTVSFCREELPGCLMDVSASMLSAFPVISIRVPLLSTNNESVDPLINYRGIRRHQVIYALDIFPYFKSAIPTGDARAPMAYGSTITIVTPNGDVKFWRDVRQLRITPNETSIEFEVQLSVLCYFIKTSAADCPDMSSYRFKFFLVRELVLVHALIVLCVHWLHAVHITHTCASNFGGTHRQPGTSTSLTNAVKLLAGFLQALYPVLESILDHPLFQKFTSDPSIADSFFAKAPSDLLCKDLMINVQAFKVAVVNSQRLRLLGPPNLAPKHV